MNSGNVVRIFYSQQYFNENSILKVSSEYKGLKLIKLGRTWMNVHFCIEIFIGLKKKQQIS